MRGISVIWIEAFLSTMFAAATCLQSISEAYGPLLTSHWEKKENPQHYDELVSQQVHPQPRRHLLGLVGGNEVSLIQGNMVDLESDLRGIHLPNTFAPWRQYQPPVKGQTEIVRNTTKGSVTIHTQKIHLPTYQMFAYPAVMAPEPMVNQTCMKPEKF